MKKPLVTSVTYLQYSAILACVLLGATVALYFSLNRVMKQESDVSRFFSLSTVKDNYYYNETQGPITVQSKNVVNKAIPLPLPVKSMDEVLSWSTQVAVQLFTVNFFKIDSQIGELRPYFTSSGWDALNSALIGSGWAAGMVEKKLSSTAVVSGPPIVVRHGVLDGSYSWVINFPLLVTYEGASEKRSEDRVFTVTVRRINADYASGQAGMAIDSFVTKASGGN